MRLDITDPPAPPRTIQELAAEVLAVQDACNLSGVAQSFGRAMVELWNYVPSGAGTEWVNTHPISKLWADKVAHLTGTQYGASNLHRAYTVVHELAEGEVNLTWGEAAR